MMPEKQWMNSDNFGGKNEEVHRAKHDGTDFPPLF
jgi:hypothetical protein